MMSRQREPTGGRQYCCKLFAEALAASGQIGMAVNAKRNSVVDLFFEIEFRALSSHDDHVSLSAENAKICREVRQAISYCPFCGTNLHDHYNSRRELFAIVADADMT